MLLSRRLLLGSALLTSAQTSRTVWPAGIRCALSLSFDDARASQLESGIPLLRREGVRATFYVNLPPVERNAAAWKALLTDGHEIGNHTSSHPCSGNFPFSRRNPLEDFNLDRMAADLDRANTSLAKLIGTKPASFAYPCGQQFVGRGTQTASYVPLIAQRFLSGRGFRSETMNDPAFCDFAALQASDCDERSFAELRIMLDAARESGRWLILAGHEMKESGRQATRLSELTALIRYAKQPGSGVWLDTVTNITRHLMAQRPSAIRA
jgi:peptidoglycan-N-acetylglucosamine deacetylase